MAPKIEITNIIRNDENQKIIRMTADAAGLDMTNAARLFGDIWPTTHGIASMVATNICDFSDEQIAEFLTDSFLGLKYQIGLKGVQPNE